MLPFLRLLKIFKLGWCSTYRRLSSSVLQGILPQMIVAELEYCARYIVVYVEHGGYIV
jgi:hypothetical protein